MVEPKKKPLHIFIEFPKDSAATLLETGYVNFNPPTKRTSTLHKFLSAKKDVGVITKQRPIIGERIIQLANAKFKKQKAEKSPYISKSKSLQFKKVIVQNATPANEIKTEIIKPKEEEEEKVEPISKEANQSKTPLPNHVIVCSRAKNLTGKNITSTSNIIFHKNTGQEKGKLWDSIMMRILSQGMRKFDPKQICKNADEDSPVSQNQDQSPTRKNKKNKSKDTLSPSKKEKDYETIVLSSLTNKMEILEKITLPLIEQKRKKKSHSVPKQRLIPVPPNEKSSLRYNIS